MKGRSGIWESGPAWLACLEVCSWPYRRPLGTWWDTLRMVPWPSLSAVPPHHHPPGSRHWLGIWHILIPCKQKGLYDFRWKCLLITTVNRVEGPPSQPTQGLRQGEGAHSLLPHPWPLMVGLSATIYGFLCCALHTYVNETRGL